MDDCTFDGNTPIGKVILDTCGVGNPCWIKAYGNWEVGKFYVKRLISARRTDKTNAYAGPACKDNSLPKRLAGICETPLFKHYVACIEEATPRYDPKGNVLSNENFPPESSVLAVITDCESIAEKFGKKYGNDLANVLQEVANQRVSKQYGTAPLKEPEGDRSTFLEYGQSIDPSEIRRGDIGVPGKRARRPVINAPE